MSSYDECIRTNFARLRANPHGYQTNNDVAELLKAYDMLRAQLAELGGDPDDALAVAVEEVKSMFAEQQKIGAALPPAGTTTTYSEHVTEQTKLGDGNA